MLVYVAARFDERDKVKRVYQRLTAMGHQITADWTTHDPIARYGERPDLAQVYAAEDLDGVASADLFIFFTSPTVGTGTHTELGVAIQKQKTTGKPRIFVVGDNNNRSLMYFHPSVEREQSFESVLKRINESS